jgi:hypothetical protein
LSRTPPKTVSKLLANWQAGDDEALRAVVRLVYDELRRLAHHHLQKERPDHTLQSAALMHETYLRLEKQGAGPFSVHSIVSSLMYLQPAIVESGSAFEKKPVAFPSES